MQLSPFPGRSFAKTRPAVFYPFLRHSSPLSLFTVNLTARVHAHTGTIEASTVPFRLRIGDYRQGHRLGSFSGLLGETTCGSDADDVNPWTRCPAVVGGSTGRLLIREQVSTVKNSAWG